MGGEDGTPYLVGLPHQDLAAVDTFRRSLQADPAFLEFQVKIQSLISRPVVNTLDETLLAPSSSPGLTVPYITQTTRAYPIPGKGPEIRAILEERVKGFHAQGLGGSVRRTVFGSDGPVFAVAVPFQSLGDIDDFRQRNQSDSAYREATTKLQALIRRPGNTSLVEVLIT